ncbi:MAG: VCBS repeat-containing protein [Planctomycetes bacterium]|nr:VCBS repeat-containing protein [Planctomycetota bacterium]
MNLARPALPRRLSFAALVTLGLLAALSWHGCDGRRRRPAGAAAPNVAPSFTRGPDQVVTPGAGPQVVAGWATSISPGPASEAWQRVTFEVTASPAALFSSQPAVDRDGTLTFTPVASGTGTATVTVVARDDGGTAGGGVDASAPQTFTIALRSAPAITFDRPTWIEATVGEDLLLEVTASDADGDPVTLKLLNPPPGSAFAPATAAASPARRSFRWPLMLNCGGVHQLRFQASDGTRTTTATVTVQVSGVVNSGNGLFVGDVTGDGVLDVVAASSSVDLPGAENAGAVYVWAGRTVPDGAPTATLAKPNPTAGDRLGSLTEVLNNNFVHGIVLADVTGDGVLDVVVAGSRVNAPQNTGAVLVWAGGPGLAGTPAPTATLVRPNADSGHLGNTGGSAFVVGDVTGDGVLDIVVGCPDASATEFLAGVVLVWAGGSGLAGTPAPRATLGLTNPTADDRLGLAAFRGSDPIKLGDVTGDGILDVVVVGYSVSTTVGYAGAVVVWAGGGGLAGEPAPRAVLQRPGPSVGDNMGHMGAGVSAIRLGDVTGDGILDVIVGGSSIDTTVANAGAVLVWAGGVGLTGTPPPTAELQRPGPTALDRLGDETGPLGIVLGDVTGDGVLDVIVGGSGIDTTVANAGEVLVWAGGAGLTGSPTPTATLRRPAPVADDRLGSVNRTDGSPGILLADVTGDGVLDLIVAGEQIDTNVVDAGAVLVWAGGATLTGAPAPTATLLDPTATAQDRLGDVRGGRGVLLGDVTGDGVVDVVVGGARIDTSVVDAGAVLVWAGGTGLTGTPAPTARLQRPNPVANDALSGGIAAAVDSAGALYLVDVTGDQVLDVVVAGALIDTSVADAGAVLVWAGGAGLSGTPAPTATLERPGAVASDRLGQVGVGTGQALLFGDVTGDGIVDVVVGGCLIDTAVQDAGAVLVWAGGAALAGTPAPLAELRRENPVQSDRLGDLDAPGGFGLQLADVTGDGVLDVIAAGARIDTTVQDAGAVLIWAGGPGLSSTPTAELAVPGASARDRLGGIR